MEINAQEIIDRLTSKIARLERDKVVLEVQVETLQAHLEQATQDSPGEKEDPLEGEVIG